MPVFVALSRASGHPLFILNPVVLHVCLDVSIGPAFSLVCLAGSALGSYLGFTYVISVGGRYSEGQRTS